MKEVLDLIEKRKQEFSRLPLFLYMQDKSIPALQRLAYAPCLAPFAMGFSHLNKYDFRKEPTEDPIQKIINRHTYEDDYHWIWYLEDLNRLGFDKTMKFSDAIKFYWGDETYKTRQICHQIALHIFNEEPIVVLAAIEAIEATGKVAFSLAAEVAGELQQITNQNYPYFGRNHVYVETGHTKGTDEVEQLLERIELTETQRKKAFYIVEKVVDVFSESVEEMMNYAKNHPVMEDTLTLTDASN